MALPDFTPEGDLPPGVYQATLAEVIARFGSEVGRRELVTGRLQHLWILSQSTGQVRRFVLFGSYVTAKADPGDIDIALVMDDAFRLEACPAETRGLFDHAVAQARYGASIFWIRPTMLIGEAIEEFVSSWQFRRDGGRRGIVEVVT